MSRFKKAALSCAVVLLVLLLPCFPAFAETSSIQEQALTGNFDNVITGTVDGHAVYIASLKTSYANYALETWDYNFYANQNESVTVSFDYAAANYVFDTNNVYQNCYIDAITFESYYSNSNDEQVKIDLSSQNIAIAPGDLTGHIEFSFNSPVTASEIKWIKFTLKFRGGNNGCGWSSTYGQVGFRIISDITWNVGNDVLADEKNQAAAGGNSATDELGSVIPNDSEGFISALQSFVGAMSSTETDCLFTIPQIKIPAVSDIIPDTVLVHETQFDLGQMFEIIPTAIMAVLRALFTIALVCFCFKELYDVIEYVLTLSKSKGGAD